MPAVVKDNSKKFHQRLKKREEKVIWKLEWITQRSGGLLSVEISKTKEVNKEIKMIKS